MKKNTDIVAPLGITRQKIWDDLARAGVGATTSLVEGIVEQLRQTARDSAADCLVDQIADLQRGRSGERLMSERVERDKSKQKG